MKKKVIIVIAILSVLILIIGIVSGVSVSLEMMQSVSESGNITVDGANFTGLIRIFGNVGSVAIGLIIVFYSLLAIATLWAIYGIVMLVIIIIKNIKKRKNNLRF